MFPFFPATLFKMAMGKSIAWAVGALVATGAIVGSIYIWNVKRGAKNEIKRELQIKKQSQALRNYDNAIKAGKALRDKGKPLESTDVLKSMTPQERVRAALDAIKIGKKK